MRLKQLELVGFKSFAKKTTLDFPGGIVAIVGPNGTGKSNIVDAIRWVLAEQSFKNLRGKKGDDLIFHGSTGRAALSRARVSLALDNTGSLAGKDGLDIEDIVISRVISKNGDSSYLLNGRRVRLMDLEAYLAKSAIGASSFRVLSQGMSDMLITLGPDEFKAFIEDAAGVTEFQDKRHRSLLKINSTNKNLEKVAALLAELSPREKFLKKEVNKLLRRDKVVKDLVDTAKILFSFRHQKLSKRENLIRDKKKKLEASITKAKNSIESVKRDLFSHSDRKSNNTKTEIEEEIQKVRTKEHNLKKLTLFLGAEIERNERSTKLPISASELEKGLDKILKKGERIIKEDKLSFDIFENFLGTISSLLVKIRGERGQNKEGVRQIKKELEEARKKSVELEITLKELVKKRNKIVKELLSDRDTTSKKEKDFEIAHENLRVLERELDSFELEEEKIKLRKEQIHNDLRSLDTLTLADVLKNEPPTKVDEEELEKKLWRLKKKVDQIGGIDPATKDEYEGVRQRVEFLEKEKSDLSKTLDKLEKVIGEIDKNIERRFKDTLSKMSDLFADYVRLMFGGGKAELKHIASTEENEAGIKIKVSLPGKRISSLTMLSGGERTLVSIALLFSLVTVRKPPFLVLDEIDAALDETNSEKFIRLIKELSKDTQFIIITHNRSTMYGADALYGVSMKDGASRLLSIKIEEPESLTA